MNKDLHWEKIGKRPHHGICLPLSAIRTKEDSGIGEFLDLIPLISWCRLVGFDCLQLLPINDSAHDPSPYNPISSCALDPIYLKLSSVGIEEQLPPNRKVDREKVLTQKIELLFTFFKKNGPPASSSYDLFIEENPWLHTYATFKEKEEGHPAEFYLFLQYHCFLQMGKVKAHATEQGVFLKGDIPILLSAHSADVLSNPNLFRCDIDAGAPPDYYNDQGQHWGFPLFNWPAMKKDHFSWWKQRLQTAEKLFHIYRIDHIVGFFRIWGIAKGKKPKEGSFFPPDQKLWAAQGKEILQMFLNATTMLPIGEDLGVIPDEVYPIMKELGICGTKVIRWQKNWNGDKHFIPLDKYEPLSMTTLSTPDMDPLEVWWKKFPDEAAPFARFMQIPYHPILRSEERFKILQAAHHTSSFFHINLLQEYLALFPELVSENPEEERINFPGTFLPSNWTYRFNCLLEEITSHKGLQDKIQELLNKKFIYKLTPSA